MEGRCDSGNVTLYYIYFLGLRTNVTDANGFKHVCPNEGAVYTDKGYCVKPAKRAANQKGVHLSAIKKNNMQGKNRDLDRWISRI